MQLVRCISEVQRGAQRGKRLNASSNGRMATSATCCHSLKSVRNTVENYKSLPTSHVLEARHDMVVTITPCPTTASSTNAGKTAQTQHSKEIVTAGNTTCQCHLKLCPSSIRNTLWHVELNVTHQTSQPGSINHQPGWLNIVAVESPECRGWMHGRRALCAGLPA